MPEKNWKLELSKDSWKYLEKLGKKRSLQILDRLEEVGERENPTVHQDVRPLAGKLKGFYRLRIGELRVIFEIDWAAKRIGVLAIVPRGNAY